MKYKEFWIDDLDPTRCGPWSEVWQLGWPNYEKCYRVIEHEAFEILRDALNKVVTLLEGSPSIAPLTDELVLEFARKVLKETAQ